MSSPVFKLAKELHQDYFCNSFLVQLGGDRFLAAHETNSMPA